MKILIFLQILFLISSVTISDQVKKKEKQITDNKNIEEFLTEEKVIRIGFYDKANDEVYIVPLNYGYIFDNINIFFICMEVQKEENLN